MDKDGACHGEEDAGYQVRKHEHRQRRRLSDLHQTEHLRYQTKHVGGHEYVNHQVRRRFSQDDEKGALI